MAIRVILNVSDRHYRFRLNISKTKIDLMAPPIAYFSAAVALNALLRRSALRNVDVIDIPGYW